VAREPFAQRRGTAEAAIPQLYVKFNVQPLGCLLRRLSFFRPSVLSRSILCRACIFSIMSSLLLHPLIHCTTYVTPACDAAVYFLTLFAIAFLWLLMNVAIV
jgi:hypothetical protein